MINPGLNDKTVLITGANHGIGAATAKAFAGQGAQVFLSYLRLAPEEFGISTLEAQQAQTPGWAFYHGQRALSAEYVVQDIRRAGGRVEQREADLSQPDSISQLFDRVEDTFGAVEVLVNKAAHWKPDTFFTLRAEDHDRHFAVNSRGVALMMAEFGRRHVQRQASWGRVVNVSTDGASAFPGEVSYGASKHALESYSRSAAIELGSYGITVNVVSPGPIQTGWIVSEQERGVEGYSSWTYWKSP